MKRIIALIVFLALVFGISACEPTICPPPENNSYDFENAEELRAFFTEEEAKKHEGEFAGFISEMAKDTSKLKIPYLSGEPLALRNRGEGYSNITLLESELYGRPWIWFYCINSGGEVIIRTTYLNGDEAKGLSASEFIKKIAPDAPNIDNFKSYENYKNVYEKEINVSENQISALVCEMSDSEQIYVFLIYEDMLVIIRANAEYLGEDFFAELSFA
ncbi:MAG: hypothetical protein IJX55_07330 [Clostridia bacterium]|nr:hypothetical protein [Clostridia bacterium]